MALFSKLKLKKREGGLIEAVAGVSISGDSAVLSFSGDWFLENKRTIFKKIENALLGKSVLKLSFDTSKLGEYDSSLVCMIFRAYELCLTLGISVDLSTLPAGPRELLRLAVSSPESTTAKGELSGKNYLKRLGENAMDVITEVKSQAEFVGEVTIAAGRAVKGRTRFRMSDLIFLFQKSGPEALSIVGLISFLVGLILAFVGAVQLAKYGSEIFVADLVAIAMVREMGAIMVGIVMSGRTGAAFAAELGSMKVNEEISALRTFGISPVEFLVYPRIVALVLMFPVLTVFANVIGMLGGMVIGIGLFDLSAEQYINRTIASLTLTQCATGVGKSIVFGLVVACIGCMRGMRCENSSAGVGMATTTSVVQSITWIIVIDAIFAVAFNIFDI